MEHDRHEALRAVMLARSRQVVMRLGLGGVLLVGFGASVGWRLAFGWLALYAGLQALEATMFRRLYSLNKAGPWLTLLVLNSVVFGGFAMALCLTYPPWGFIGASLLLAGAVLNTVVVNNRCGPAFAASISPFAVYCAATPLLAWRAGASLPVVSNIAVGVALIVVTAVLVWRQGYALARSELLARQELEARRREAEAAVEAKGAFVAMVSHELRTPLTAIAASAARARDHDAPPPVRAAAAAVDDAARMMKRLLDDLLDLAKLDAARLQIETIAFDPSALMQEVVDFWSPAAAAKGLTLTFVARGDTPESLGGDPMRIRQVLNNLFSNAIKFTQSGTVSLTTVVRPVGDHHALSATVSDTGPGVDPQGLEALFEPYAQGGASTARKFGGTGLGLAISRRLARLMKGDLVVQSTPGGAAFTFTCALDPAPETIESTAAAPSQPLEILVVDDHPSNRQALSILLEPAGARISLAGDGMDALAQLGARPFDLVLMDVTMDGIDGLETTRRLRRMPGPNIKTPVVAVTGHVSPEMVTACRAAGMTAVLGKPVEPRMLFCVINDVLGPSDSAEERAAA